MFRRTTPEAMNVDRAGIARFIRDMREKHLHLHTMMILRHGEVIVEESFAPWNAERLHMLYSLSKSFTSTAVGFAVQDGLLKTDDKLISFFPELLPCEPCENMKKMTIKHMLTMNTGHHREPRHLTDRWREEFLRSYVEHEPGTHFQYNTYATYMLAAVVQKVTGKKLISYLREKLMDPLGMSPDIWFEESPEGIATGGYGLNVRIEDIAKLGQFYLQGGQWEGKQLLNAQWVRDAQTPWSDNASPDGTPSDWGSGYGYQFWMCMPEKVFRGDGAFGQYCIMMPEQDMVIAINSGVEDMGAGMKSIWANILPAVDGGEKHPEAGWENVIPARWEDDGEETGNPEIDPAWIGRYRFLPGIETEEMTIEIREKEIAWNLHGFDGVYPLNRERWMPVSRTGKAAANEAHYPWNAAVRAARKGQEMILHICYVNTPYEAVFRMTFTAHGMMLRGHRNEGMGRKDIALTGIRI